MDKSKRQFLGKMASVSVGAALIPVVQVQAQQAQTAATGKRYGMVIDLRRCVGCQACTVACTFENLPPLGQFRTTVQQYEVSQQDAATPPAFLMLPRLCNHCENPPCIPICPTVLPSNAQMALWSSTTNGASAADIVCRLAL